MRLKDRLADHIGFAVAEDQLGRRFQLVTTPSSVLPMMASEDEATIAASRASACSAP